MLLITFDTYICVFECLCIKYKLDTYHTNGKKTHHKHDRLQDAAIQIEETCLYNSQPFTSWKSF